MIDSPNGLFPVDFKASEASVRENHVVQLCGYALLLEEKFRRTVDRGFIFLSPIEEIVPIDITTERKERAVVLLAERSLSRFAALVFTLSVLISTFTASLEGSF